MKHTQHGFIVPLVLIIVAALAIGGGMYYRHQYRQQVQQDIVQRQDGTDIDHSKDTPVPPTPTKKQVVLSFEAKARAAAQKGECGKHGTIGAATKIQEEYEYAIFTINTSTGTSYCAVDLYAGTTTTFGGGPVCDAGGKNCQGTGLIPTPRKLYESIPVAPDPSTFR